ncbi:MAG: hypothetical protein WAN11_17840 [Syntrophobacteraceae bacterium]
MARQSPPDRIVSIGSGNESSSTSLFNRFTARGSMETLCRSAPRLASIPLTAVSQHENAVQAAEDCVVTEDMGYRDEIGLHLSGRAKLVIKSSVYRVFPGDMVDPWTFGLACLTVCHCDSSCVAR